MLVLTRNPGEQIVFPEVEISVTVVQVRGNNVKVGVSAPKNLTILRDELQQKQQFPKLLKEYAMSRQINHDLRGSANTLLNGAKLLKRQMEKGMPQDQLFHTLDMMLGAEEKIEETSKIELSSPTALLVEDDHNERELLAGMLRMSGVNVITKGTGQEAISYLRSDQLKPDVVLLDLGLSDMDGTKVVRIIQEDQIKGMKVFIVSGRDKRDIPTEIVVDRIFRKPLSPEGLVKELVAMKQTA